MYSLKVFKIRNILCSLPQRFSSDVKSLRHCVINRTCICDQMGRVVSLFAFAEYI